MLTGTDLVTVKARDADILQANREFDIRILSVSPTPSDLEFNLLAFRETGTIRFNGCLDHEVKGNILKSEVQICYDEMSRF